MFLLVLCYIPLIYNTSEWNVAIVTPLHLFHSCIHSTLPKSTLQKLRHKSYYFRLNECFSFAFCDLTHESCGSLSFQWSMSCWGSWQWLISLLTFLDYKTWKKAKAINRLRFYEKIFWKMCCWDGDSRSQTGNKRAGHSPGMEPVIVVNILSYGMSCIHFATKALQRGGSDPWSCSQFIQCLSQIPGPKHD